MNSLKKCFVRYWGIPVFALGVTMILRQIYSVDPGPPANPEEALNFMNDNDRARPVHIQTWYLVVSMLATIFGAIQIIGIAERWMGWKKGDGVALFGDDCDGGD